MQILSITYTEEEKVHAAVIRKRNRKFDRVPIEEIGFLCRSSYVYFCTRKFCPMSRNMAITTWAKNIKTLDITAQSRQAMPAVRERFVGKM
jgi:hypothetical protein